MMYTFFLHNLLGYKNCKVGNEIKIMDLFIKTFEIDLVPSLDIIRCNKVRTHNENERKEVV